MILVDANVIIDYIKTADPRLLRLFQTYAGAVCGVTRAEILHGARNPANRNHLLGILNTFLQVPIADNLWDQIGDNLAALRAGGVTVPFPDVIIGTVAIENDIELWTRDAQFQLMKPLLPKLKLFLEPP